VTIPANWGRGAREGLVVEFVSDTGEIWVGNFQPGFGGVDDVRQHPNGRDIVVVSAGSAWVVDPDRRKTADMGVSVDAVWSVSEPDGLVMSRQGLAFFRLGSRGCVWHTRRISWDGLKQVCLSSTEVTGFAWAPWTPEWTPFTVDLRSGRVQGGSYNGPDATEWEALAID
jgi:hypothetical protein